MEERVIYPLELIKTGIYFLDIVDPDKIIDGDYPYNAMRSLFFYTFKKVKDGIIPLNREYKPIGLSEYSGFVKIEEYNFLIIPNKYIDFEAIVLCDGTHIFTDRTYPEKDESKKRYRDRVNKFFKGIYSDILDKMKEKEDHYRRYLAIKDWQDHT